MNLLTVLKRILSFILDRPDGTQAELVASLRVDFTMDEILFAADKLQTAFLEFEFAAAADFDSIMAWRNRVGRDRARLGGEMAIRNIFESPEALTDEFQGKLDIATAQLVVLAVEQADVLAEIARLEAEGDPTKAPLISVLGKGEQLVSGEIASLTREAERLRSQLASVGA